jgi:hypothetical protein
MNQFLQDRLIEPDFISYTQATMIVSLIEKNNIPLAHQLHSTIKAESVGEISRADPHFKAIYLTTNAILYDELLIVFNTHYENALAITKEADQTKRAIVESCV